MGQLIKVFGELKCTPRYTACLSRVTHIFLSLFHLLADIAQNRDTVLVLVNHFIIYFRQEEERQWQKQ